MIEIGKYNLLKAYEMSDYGMYMCDLDEDEQVLLPNGLIPEGLKVGDKIKLFVYNDSEDRPVATTMTPKAEIGSFAWMKVLQNTSFGSFLEYGVQKDLLVPFKEQPQRLVEGEEYLVYVYLDEETERIVGSTRLEKFLNQEDFNFNVKDEVDIEFWTRTELGFKVIINNKFTGLVFSDQVFRPIKLGEKCKGYVSQIREDHKIDISLQQIGYTKIVTNTSIIIDALKAADGYLPLHDKSDPDLIRQQLGMSKKIFKNAIGGLFKDRQITIKPDGIYLNKHGKQA